MQNETYIILLGLLAGWVLTTFYFLKAMKRVNRLRDIDLDKYQTSLKEAKQRYLELYRQTLSFGTFLSRKDAHLLLNTADTCASLKKRGRHSLGLNPQAQERAHNKRKSNSSPIAP